MQQEYILVEFKGTYRAPHPDGYEKDVQKDFHVKVKMKRGVLAGPGTCGHFQAYYKGHLKKIYPDFKDTYFFEMVEATELDGSIIHNPKAYSQANLIDYIARMGYPINPILYPTGTDLRNEVVLYENDKNGQQHLQRLLEDMKGAEIRTAAELRELGEIMFAVEPVSTVSTVEPTPAPAELPVPAAVQPESVVQEPAKEPVAPVPASAPAKTGSKLKL